jgi:preprotein translocase subunit YajC
MHVFLLISVLALLSSSTVVFFLVLVLFLQLAIMLMSRQENTRKQRNCKNWSVTGTAGFTG